MDTSQLYLIGDVAGFTPQIGRLVSMMNYVRHTTLTAVADLSVEELDYLHDPQTNSIGALLLHIAAAEVGYQAATFYARDLTEDEKHDDSWLEEQTSLGNGQSVNNYFKWFHIFSHEINHRGQIRWLRTRAAKRP